MKDFVYTLVLKTMKVPSILLTAQFIKIKDLNICKNAVLNFYDWNSDRYL